MLNVVVHIVTTELWITGTTNLELHLVGNYVLQLHLYSKGTGKGKVRPRTGHEDPEGELRYSYTLSLTSALDEVGGQRDVPAA
jgi:hypothetical protein